jgi:hypothetical protein
MGILPGHIYSRLTLDTLAAIAILPLYLMQIIQNLDNDHAMEILDCLEVAKRQLNDACRLLCQADPDGQRQREVVDHTAEACDQTSNAIAALKCCIRHYEEVAEEIRAGV